MSIITLLTDFGMQDAYVGVMKGVILSVDPQATIIDLTHQVAPQDIAQGAFLLGTAARHFPPGTVHVAVVDPGVGTARQPIAVQGPGGIFVGPDNGLLTHALGLVVAAGEARPADPVLPTPTTPPLRPAAVPAGWHAVVLGNPEFWRHPVSRTFHGRDIFAPVAAHLASGVSLDRVGTPITTLFALDLPRPCNASDGALVGRVVAVDHFGNLMTNLTPTDLPSGPSLVFEVAGWRIAGLSETYSGVRDLIALVSSSGQIEIAVRNGSARGRLGVGVGSRVLVRTA